MKIVVIYDVNRYRYLRVGFLFPDTATLFEPIMRLNEKFVMVIMKVDRKLIRKFEEQRPPGDAASRYP